MLVPANPIRFIIPNRDQILFEVPSHAAVQKEAGVCMVTHGRDMEGGDCLRDVSLKMPRGEENVMTKSEK